ncbi:venom serine protease 34-like, partial [Drosophila subpulchrella]|uniref:venom serine protease 34-like n=1 Tax=Drosophila subpulchrella TaxID=1486046 RepID=UPI0018A17EC7
IVAIQAASVTQECGKFNEEQFKSTNIIAEPNEHPWVGRIEQKDSDGNNRLRGTAILIDARHVVTAAHCVLNKHGQPIIEVIFGDSDSSNRYLISSVTIHPNYTESDLRFYDLALIELTKDVKFSDFVQPICLPSAEVPKAEQSNPDLRVAGYEGRSVGRRGSDTTRLDNRIKQTFNRMDSKECHKLQDHFPEELICGQTEKPPFSGSALTEVSGNPKKFHLIGIAVVGFSSHEMDFQGYLDIRSFLDWIRSES